MESKLSKPKKKRGPPSGFMPSPQSLANLCPFKKGENGQNGWSLKSELKMALTRQRRQEFVNSTIEGAILREPTPFKELWERVDGKVKEEHAITGDILIEVVYRDKKYGDDTGKAEDESPG